MTLKVFAIYDGKTKCFLKPFMDTHTGSALRSFETACKEPQSPFYQFPTDFVLYEIGTFDQETGEMSSYSPKIQLATPIEYQKPQMRQVPLTQEAPVNV